MTRIGVVINSAGGALLAAHSAMQEHLPDPPNFHILTDRACEVEPRCDALGIGRTRIEEPDADRFSEQAGRVLVDEQGVDLVLLFFHRIVGEGLLRRVPVLNIHPSLLPSFKGFSPIKQAVSAGVKVLGATLHLATDAVDNGPILAQVCQPIAEDAGIDDLNRVSFLQKACLTMLACEAAATGRLVADLSTMHASLKPTNREPGDLSPTFATDAYRDAFCALRDRQDIPGPGPGLVP